MATFEQELKNFEPMIRFLSGLSLLGKKVVVRGGENFVREGPNIIVGNHIGSYKDVATLFRIVPRPIFFTANREIFNKQDLYFLIRRYLKRHLKDFGWTVDRLITPLKSLFAGYISANIAKIGTIPVNMKTDATEKTGEAVALCEGIVRSGRALITLQGRGRLNKKLANPYVDNFRRGFSFIAYNLYVDHRLDVPVTPLAFYGTHVPVLVPGRVRVNVGAPMYVRDYAVQNVPDSVERFRAALEARVKELFLELIRRR
jgi:1-acyl-sn-glycerol-3-phosphate acyltransferase